MKHLVARGSPRLLIVLGLLFIPSILRAEWYGGRDEVFTITVIENRTITVAGSKTLIHAWTENIRRERPNGGSAKATLADLRPGVRIRAFGRVSSSPTKILIQEK
jgi:hypothetical protein